jgi:hypothetical protein
MWLLIIIGWTALILFVLKVGIRGLRLIFRAVGHWFDKREEDLELKIKG